MKLFISYSRDDKQWVHEFARSLRGSRSRYSVWYDADLHVSHKWWDEILEQLEGCDVFVVILTPSYERSSFCMAELDYALALNKPIMPMRMKECHVPAKLSVIQYMDIESLEMSDILSECAFTLADLHLEIDEGHYPAPATQPLRPPAPTPKSTLSDDPFELFTAIQVAAEQGDFSRADQFAQHLKQIDPGGFGVEIDDYLSKQRLGKTGLGAYLKIVAMVEVGKMDEADLAWRVYVRQFGTQYDPEGYATLLGEMPSPHRVVHSSPRHDPADSDAATQITDDKGVTMIYVPAGKYLMGSTSTEVDAALQQAIAEGWKDAKRDAFAREEPQHDMVIGQPFWLDLTPVTNASYARFIEEDGYRTPQFWTKTGWAWAQARNDADTPRDYGRKFNDPQQPRVGVTWYEAYAYCQWRQGRLPTEAEWEWTARGENNLIYPWGNQFIPANVTWNNNAAEKTSIVGSKPTGASWIGALDMSGNVWEWVSSAYQPYPYNAEDGREDPDTVATIRVMRGGSWLNLGGSTFLRAAYRSKFAADGQNTYVGFRVARSV